MRHLNGWEDAAIVNARVGAAKMGFIQWKEGYGPEFQDGDDVPEISAEAGVFETLPEGAEMKEWNPQYPSGEFAPFTKYMLRGMAAGMGVPYNELAADLEGVNFSSIRQGTLDSREHWKERQEWLIETMIQRIFDAWLPRALLQGRIKNAKGVALPAAKLDRFSVVSWQARRWQWIDPRADVDAAVNSKNNMLASPGQIIRESGRDPQTVWAETARDLAAMRDALVAEGIEGKAAMELVMLSMGKEPAQQTAPKETKNEEIPS
jgi:lambda family phage portal protein